MLGPMVAQPPPRAPGGHDRAKRTFTDGAGAAVLAVVTSAAEAEAAVAGGADLLDLPDAAPDTIAAVRARCPGILLCGAGRAADVVRDAAAARASGALLLCAGIEAARASDLPPGRLLVSVPPGLVQEAAQAGWAVLVDADRAAAQLSRGESAGSAPAGSAPAGSAPGGSAPGGSAPGGSAPAEEAPAGSGPTGGERAEQDQAGIVAMAALSSWLGAAVVRTRHPVPVRRALDMAASIRGVRPPARTVRGLA